MTEPNNPKPDKQKNTKTMGWRDLLKMCFEPVQQPPKQQQTSSCQGCSCGSDNKPTQSEASGTVLDKKVSRRKALGFMAGAAAVTGTAVANATSVTKSSEKKELSKLKWQEFFKGNFRLMTEKEQKATVERLERISELRDDLPVEISKEGAKQKVLYGYAFNIDKCQGYQDCVKACIKENNQDRDSNMQYIRIFEMENGEMSLEDGKADYFGEVPEDGHFYLGTQCFQCENPPCTTVCPVGATWKEPDGIVVIDYDWCIGCRYCQAACPYWARRFNWSEPQVPKEEVNPKQHYLSNRVRKKGVMEKCTFCLQRSRQGLLPACVEACPTGARVFGNLLDPNSDIRYVLENKKVFRLKEELGTEPKFWYFMD